MTVVEGLCEQCGRGTHLNEEGRVSCDGCDMATDLCQCEDKGTGGHEARQGAEATEAAEEGPPGATAGTTH